MVESKGIVRPGRKMVPLPAGCARCSCEGLALGPVSGLSKHRSSIVIRSVLHYSWRHKSGFDYFSPCAFHIRYGDFLPRTRTCNVLAFPATVGYRAVLSGYRVRAIHHATLFDARFENEILNPIQYVRSLVWTWGP